MRRIVPYLLISAALAGCDPTGNGVPIGVSSTDLRVANFVTDANGINVFDNDGVLFTSVPFASTSQFTQISADTDVFTFRQTTPDFVIGSDTFNLLADKIYTLYVVGEMTAHRTLLAKRDTILPAAGQYRIRFIHGIESFSPFALDFFDDSTSSLIGLTPSWPGLGYAVGSNYVAVDTGVRRIRITKTGLTTTILDTVLPDPIPSGSVVTLVASNVAGGGAGIEVHIVNDTTP